MRFLLLIALFAIIGCDLTEPNPDFFKVEIEIQRLDDGVLQFNARALPPDTLFGEVTWNSTQHVGGVYLIAEPREDIRHLVAYPPEHTILFTFSAWTPRVRPDSLEFLHQKGVYGHD